MILKRTSISLCKRCRLIFSTETQYFICTFQIIMLCMILDSKQLNVDDAFVTLKVRHNTRSPFIVSLMYISLLDSSTGK